MLQRHVTFGCEYSTVHVKPALEFILDDSRTYLTLTILELHGIFVETVCNLVPELDVKFKIFAIVTTLHTYICRDTPHDIRTSAKKHTSTMIHIFTRYVRLS